MNLHGSLSAGIARSALEPAAIMFNPSGVFDFHGMGIILLMHNGFILDIEGDAIPDLRPPANAEGVQRNSPVRSAGHG